MIEIFIFLLVAFLYIHIVSQYKSNEDLDVYEIDYYDNVNLQETCNLMQPFLFSTYDIFPKLPNLQELASLRSASPQLILYEKGDPTHPFEIPLKMATESVFFNPPTPQESHKQYYSEGNSRWMSNMADLSHDMHSLDSYLKPAFTASKEYDMLSGSIMCTTPFKYHRNTRKFLVVNEGEICLKMAPWKSNKLYLYEVVDTVRGEIRSTVDVWNPSLKHKSSWEKIQFMEVLAKGGQVVYIPPYWGYSIQYRAANSQLYEVTYSTVFNRVAFLGEIVQNMLQRENTVYKKWPSVEQVKVETKDPDSPKEFMNQENDGHIDQEITDKTETTSIATNDII